MQNSEQLAGICGLFCGTCPMYPRHCHGCLSDKLAPHCRTCPNGFRSCAKQKGVTWCFECAEFPCGRLADFLDTHWENGISHHAGAVDNLKRMKELGVATWVSEQMDKARCPKCSAIVPWNKRACRCNGGA